MARSRTQRRPRRSRTTGEGCSSWLITCVISLILFWFNVALVRSLFDLIRPSLANATHERRIEQAAVLIGPAALLLLQWWLWEVAMEWLWPDQDDEPGSVRY